MIAMFTTLRELLVVRGDRRWQGVWLGSLVDVMEELVKFTLLTRDNKDYLLDRYSERKESAAELSKRVNQKAI